MTAMWARIITKTIFWIAAEIALSCIGLDDLADYSEFVFEKNLIVTLSYAQQSSVWFDLSVQQVSTTFTFLGITVNLLNTIID